MKVDDAIKTCNQWFTYLERQKDNTERLLRAASMARAGDTYGARKIKNSVDAQPKIFDGATLEPAVKSILQELDNYNQLIEALVGEDANTRYTHEEIMDYASDLKDLEQIENNSQIYIITDDRGWIYLVRLYLDSVEESLNALQNIGYFILEDADNNVLELKDF